MDFKATSVWNMTVEGRDEWKSQRDQIDLSALVTRYLGAAKKKSGGRLWWSCPFHEDDSPSFFVKVDPKWCGCYGCDWSGDAASFVMAIERVTFPEAKAILTEGMSNRPVPARQAPKPKVVQPPPPSGLPIDQVMDLIRDAEVRLWSPAGAQALSYLTGEPRPENPAFRSGRCLTSDSIKAARLGYVDRLEMTSREGRPYTVTGVVLPWFHGDRPALVKVRQFTPGRLKYVELYRDPSLVSLYPGVGVIRAGLPLVLVEGEFDALLLGQELAGLASVVTRGNASANATTPSRATLGRMLTAPRWYIAGDSDAAGEKSSAGWLDLARCRRVRPPAPHKDWTECAEEGVNLRRWWTALLSGVASPSLYSWDELAEWRWGATEPNFDGGGSPKLAPKTGVPLLGTDHSDPIDVPHDWRSLVANLPHDEWVRWRRRSTEIQAGLGHEATVADIHDADFTAAQEMGIPGTEKLEPAPSEEFLMSVARQLMPELFQDTQEVPSGPGVEVTEADLERWGLSLEDLDELDLDY